MKHADEGRSPEDSRRQRAREALSDPEALFVRFEGLVARERRNKAKEADYKKRIAALEREVLDAKNHQDKELRRRLASVHGALEAYRKETKRLKDDLQRVRGSNSMRIGKAVLSPIHAFRRGASESTATQTGEESGAPSTTAPSPTTPAVEPAELRANERAEVPVAERSLETLRQEFEEEPSPKNFVRVINRLWFSEGAIQSPAEFIEAHPEVASMLKGKDRILAERILGENRLRQQGVSVPPRANGISYVPEPGRVMYCAHSTPLFNSNGYSTRTRGVAAGLLANGADVVVTGRPGYPWDSATDVAKPEVRRHERELDGVPYVHLPGLSLTRDPLDRYLQVAADAFVREARRQRPTLMQSASNHRTALPALVAARRLGVPFVYEVRGLWEVTSASDKPGWEQTEQYAQMVELETLVAREADLVFAITQQVADELVRRGVDPERIELAPNAVDTEQFAPIPKDLAYAKHKSIRTDVPVVGFAGSLVAYEGLQTLLEASKILLERDVEHQVVIAGSGGTAKDLRALGDELELSSVMFLGRLPMGEMTRLLSTFDIMPVPRSSTPVTELVSPLKPLEAFSMMKAVVLSDVAPHRDLAGVHPARAALAEPDDPAALADAIERLITERDAAMDLARAARQWVVHERTWRQLGADMLRSQERARGLHQDHALPGRALSELRFGVVADEFTTKTLAATVNVVPLSREEWRTQLAEDDLDLVFIESAWSGNGGSWYRGIGHYSEEESNDITELLSTSRDLGIPSVFWNKEDPVHFDRFRRTAGLCDHVFTTDADVIPKYLATPGAVSKTVASLAFYAQPKIHNPLPSSRPFVNSIAYAGTYYGERYADRSRRLERLLDTAKPFGLTIYDRQAQNPDSPYKFPPKFQEDVVGALPYDEVIDAYKSHVAQINVNSVEGSPSMFSRRVVEIASCGGIVLSSASRGMAETFGSAIASSDDSAQWRGMLFDWTNDPVERLREAWLQMRTVYRAHTAETAISVLARTAGVPVESAALPTYGLVVRDEDPAILSSIARHSVLPTQIWAPAPLVETIRAALADRVPVADERDADHTGVDFVGFSDAPVARTHFEDLLHATRFGAWDSLHYRWAGPDDHGRTLAQPLRVEAPSALIRSSVLASLAEVEQAHGTGVEMLFVPARAASHEEDDAESAQVGTTRERKTVVVAGHDLKFATAIIDDLKDAGHEVLIDRWQGHNQHDEAASAELLDRADVVFAEWGLGNAVWYSKNLRSHQRMVVRVHRQELQLPYLRAIDHSKVDAFAFVGELVRSAAVTSHGVPAEKSIIVPNFVDADGLDLPKHPGAEFTLGMVGIVPQMKRLDLAVKLLERLKEQDSRFRLRIKGKQPQDYGWMQNRPEELAYYERVYAEIDALNARHPESIVFDPHGDDMADWYRNIGVAISVSDYESFHFTIADGAASGALPVTLAWAGSEYLYPEDWRAHSIDAMAKSIVQRQGTPSIDAEIIRSRYSQDVVLPQLRDFALGV